MTWHGFTRPASALRVRGAFPWLAVVLLLPPMLAGCFGIGDGPDRSLEQVRAAGKVRVAIDPSYPPFDFVDGSQQLAGYDVDLAREIAGRLGVAVEFVAIDVGTIFDGLIARQYDLIISAIAPAPELSKEIAFGRPYFNAGQVLVSARPIESATLGGQMFAVEMGSGGEALLRQKMKADPTITIHVYESPVAALAAVSRNETAGAVLDVLTALDLVKDRPGLRLVGPALSEEPYVIAARAKDGALLAAAEQHLRDLRQEGFLEKLETNWLPGLPKGWHY